MKTSVILCSILIFAGCASNSNRQNIKIATDEIKVTPTQKGKYITSKNNKNLEELGKYKWWLQYETPEVILVEILRHKDVLNPNNPRVQELYSVISPGAEKRALCFIEKNDRTYLEMTYYDTNDKMDKIFIKDEFTTCVKRNIAYFLLDSFTNKKFTITDYNLNKLKQGQDKESKAKNSCVFQRDYFFDTWKYNMAKEPKLTKNQRLLTIIERTADCEAEKIEYYIGEKLTGPSTEMDVRSYL